MVVEFLSHEELIASIEHTEAISPSSTHEELDSLLKIAQNLPTQDLRKFVYEFLNEDTSEFLEEHARELLKANMRDLALLRYSLSRIIFSSYSKNLRRRVDRGELSIPEFRDLIQLERLEVEEMEAALSPNFYDDYLIADKIADIADYEIEERIFIRQKLIYFAKENDKPLSKRYIEELEDWKRDHQDLLKHTVTDESFSNFSFHHANINGTKINYGYFNEGAAANHLFEHPQLDQHKPVLVLLHGMFMNWACWRWMIEKLRDKFQIIVIDMPGHGESELLDPPHTPKEYAKCVLNLLGDLRVDRFTLMGHSMGGFTSQEIAKLTNKIDKLILISCAAQLKVPLVKRLLLSVTNWVRNKQVLIEKGMKEGRSAVAKTKSDYKVFFGHYHDRTMSKSANLAIYEIANEIVNKYQFATFSGFQLDTRTLIVLGENDATVPADRTRDLVQYFSNSELFAMPDTTHIDILKKFPEQHVDIIEKFLFH